MSLAHGKLVDDLRVNKHLRCELKSLCYMKSMLHNAILKYDSEILCEINLNEGMLYPDFLRKIGRADSITNGSEKNLWIIPMIEEDLSFEMNWLDKFSLSIGPNCHFEASGTPNDIAMVEESGIMFFKVGDGDVIVFGKIDCSPQCLREVMNEEDFDQKLVKATLPGVSADFPDWFKMEVTEIRLPVQIIKIFLDIGK